MLNQIRKVMGVSLVQAISAGIVVWLWSLIMAHGEEWLGSSPTNVTGIVTVLLIFMVTAVLAAGAVLGYPLYLAFHKKNWSQAVTLLSLTILWLAIISALLIWSFAK